MGVSIKNMKSRVIVLVLVSLSGLLQTSCTDGEMLTGVVAGTVGLMAGVAIADHDDDDDHHHHQSRYYSYGGYSNCVTRQQSYCDYYGCRMVRGHYCSGSFFPMSLGVGPKSKIDPMLKKSEERGLVLRVPVATDIQPSVAARVFQVTEDKAAEIISELHKVQIEKSTNLEALGFTPEAIRSLANFEMPSRDAIAQISQALGHENTETTRQVLGRLIDHAKLQIALAPRESGSIGRRSL